MQWHLHGRLSCAQGFYGMPSRDGHACLWPHRVDLSRVAGPERAAATQACILGTVLPPAEESGPR